MAIDYVVSVQIPEHLDLVKEQDNVIFKTRLDKAVSGCNNLDVRCGCYTVEFDDLSKAKLCEEQLVSLFEEYVNRAKLVELANRAKLVELANGLQQSIDLIVSEFPLWRRKELQTLHEANISPELCAILARDEIEGFNDLIANYQLGV